MYQRLRNLREDRDLNQTAVAAVLHVSQTTYSRYESGALDIPSGALIALARFYGTSVDYLLGLTDETAPYGR
nr:helix-turn-helix transcriptional regulator [uncultured Dysosmobacter sp.]